MNSEMAVLRVFVHVPEMTVFFYKSSFRWRYCWRGEGGGTL